MTLVLAIRTILRAGPPARVSLPSPLAPKLGLAWRLVGLVLASLYVAGYAAAWAFLLGQVLGTVALYFKDHDEKTWKFWELYGEVIDSHGELILAVLGALLLAHFLRTWHRRSIEAHKQWWLGEVARRVHDAYDIEWPLIAQVTRYLPLARPMRWSPPFSRAYVLRAEKLGASGTRLAFEIRVPTNAKEPIEVWEQMRGTSELRRVQPSLDTSPPSVVKPSSSARRRRKSRA